VRNVLKSIKRFINDVLNYIKIYRRVYFTIQMKYKFPELKKNDKRKWMYIRAIIEFESKEDYLKFKKEYL
jgi:hypothetical protein